VGRRPDERASGHREHDLRVDQSHDVRHEDRQVGREQPRPAVPTLEFYKTVFSQGLTLPPRSCSAPTRSAQPPLLMKQGKLAIVESVELVPDRVGLAHLGGAGKQGATEVA